MKNIFKRDKRTELEMMIDDELLYVSQIIQDQEIEAYETSATVETTKKINEAKKQKLDDLERLLELAEKCQKIKTASRLKPSPDTIAVGLFALIQIVWITKHEKLNVISSKALGFVNRGRV